MTVTHFRLAIAVPLALLALLPGGPARAAAVQVFADFSSPTGRSVSPRQLGLNVFQGFSPATAGTPGDATYKDHVAYMAPGLVRYHSWEMLGASTTPNGWLVDPAGRATRSEERRVGKECW